MKYHLLAGAAAMALVVGGSVVARAADLPMAPAVPMIAAAPAVYDWTGFYAGLNLGFGWGEFSKNAGNQKGFKDRSIDGIVGGAQIGGNWQFESFVLGVETDIQGTGFGDSKGKWKTEGGIFGTVRGRAGFAFDRFLVYGTGGFAYSDVNIKANKKGNDNWRTGWTAGGGVEAAVTDNISVKVEYLFADLGEGDWFRDNRGNRWKADFTQSLVRAGVNYKF
jgi:outer membrane immunogenic protein